MFMLILNFWIKVVKYVVEDYLIVLTCSDERV